MSVIPGSSSWTDSVSKSMPAGTGRHVLARPPMNTISMGQRDELRAGVEALDEDPRVRVIVLRAEGEHFSSGGYIAVSLRRRPNTFQNSRGTSRHRYAAANLSLPPIAAIRSGSDSKSPSPAISVLVSETCRYALPEQKLVKFPGPAVRRDCRKLSASRVQKTS